MKPKGLLIAVVLLAVLAGLVFWSNKKQAAASKTADSATKLLTIPDDQFQEIRIKKLTGETIALRRDQGKWAITQPAPQRADQDAVSSLVSNLSSLNADKVIDEAPSDLKAYGLADPTLDVSVVRKDGKTDELLIGDDTPTGSGAYAKLPTDKRVFTIASSVKTSVDKRPDDLRDKRLLTFDSDKLTRVELQAKGPAVEFGKNGANEWQIVKPRPLRADSSQIETLVGKLKDAKMDVLNPEPDAAKKFASSAKTATVTVTDNSGNQTLEIRKDKDKTYWAKSSAVDGVHKIGADIGDALDKGLDDFRQKKLFDFGFSDPNKVEVNGVTYTKSGDKWMSNGKAMDNTTVQGLIDRLRDMAAATFPDKPPVGKDEVVFTATVTSNDNKRVEKVVVHKTGLQFWAQREGEPSIYVLDAYVFGELQKQAASVKEAAPEPPKKK